MKQPAQFMLPFPAIPDHLAAACNRSPERRAWLERLPEAARGLMERWELQTDHPFSKTEGSCSWIIPVLHRDGSPAVLKLGMPHMEAEQEIDGLRRRHRIVDLVGTVDRHLLACDRVLAGGTFAARAIFEHSRTGAPVAGRAERFALERGGAVRFAGDGGPPVGLLPGMSFAETRLTLGPGERLMLHSDGITEARVAGGGLLEAEGLARLLGEIAHLPAERVLPELALRLGALGAGEAFDDDVSAVLIERPEG